MAGELDSDHLDWLIARAKRGELTPQEQQDLQILLASIPPAPPRITFREFVDKVEPNYRWWWHNLVLANCLAKVITGEIENLMVSMPPRHGKQVAHDTPILTRRGWTTHGELRLGDEVFGIDGRPTCVVGLSEETLATHEVEFTNGARITAHAAHEWAVYDRAGTGQGVRIMETQQMEARVLWGGTAKQRCVLQLPERGPLHCAARDLPVHSYVLGVWLGDGNSTKATFCYAPSDEAVLQRVIECGEKPSVIHTHKTTGVRYASFRGLRARLRDIGVLGRKHIPGLYLTAGDAQRLALLAGLVDTDGSVEPASGRVRIVTANPQLRDDIMELVRGLGWEPYYTTAQPTTTSSSGIEGRQIVYTVGFQPDRPIPCALPRKAVFVPALKRRIGVRAVRRVAPRLGRCITVDRPDGMYLVGRELIPTHNSMTISQLFVAYYQYLFPFRKVGFSSYNDTIAWFHARHAKEYYLRSGGGLGGLRDIEAVRTWQTQQGGELWVTGRGGSATGLGYHLGVGDDWLKNSDEARSPVIRQGTIEWLQSVWLTRGEPNHRKIVVGTRWPPYDPMTYLLEVARDGGEFAESWHIVNYEAIRSDQEYPVPPNCTLEPDPRPVWNGRPDHDDAALCPQRVPLRTLLARKASTSSFYFGAMYQGRPKPREGMLFKGHWFKTVDALPAVVKKRVWYWDLAGTEEKPDETTQPDWTAGIRMSLGEDGRYYIELGVRFMRRPAGRNAGLRAHADKTAGEFGRDSFRLGFEAEAGIDGDERIRTLTGVLAGYKVKHYRPRRSKVARATSADTDFAESFQSQCEVGNVVLVSDEVYVKPDDPPIDPMDHSSSRIKRWNGEFLDELCSFPNGLNDDWVDAAVGAFTMLTEGRDIELGEIIGGAAVASAPLNVVGGAYER